MAEFRTPKGNGPGELRRKPKQRNHDVFVVPEGLEAHADEPLYILVALWCMRQSGWINRRQVARAFGISERSATFQLTYITRKKARVECVIRKVKVEGNPVMSHEIRVLRVVMKSGDIRRRGNKQQKVCNETTHRSRVGNADNEARQQLAVIWNSLRRDGNK
ncbi:CaiF/GrlA family transcriptional regulator [Salmonella enterica]|nr:CaiF/GrlA family transcriptional regulator [Salmonella enterica]EHZ8203541.1 CaiF/GrlA family transcriptional regulator [Salmonella enterica]EIX8147048.1 CaiF/GrlA family transcriptional regulator [Salmonella enterica]HBI5523681.1 CaiF/GrlA family transcriptional regulator [Salmonella enterica subsp. enterica serovar Welikade]